MGFIEPKYRFKFKAMIHENGYRTVAEYARAAEVDEGKISRILRGWEIPSEDLANRLRRPLKVTLDQFGELIRG